MTPDVVNLHDAPSPCVRQCCLDDANFCMGCGRTLVEIMNWSRWSPAERWNWWETSLASPAVAYREKAIAIASSKK